MTSFLRNRNWLVEEDAFIGVMPNRTQFQGTNIIATHRNWNQATHRFILACHWESKYEATYDFIGAIDSSVPCGMMLWIADAFKTILANPTNRQLFENANVALQLLFFDGEEAIENWTATDSIYGARNLAPKWQREGKLDNIEVLVLLDLLGAMNPTFPSYFRNTDYLFRSLINVESRLTRLWNENGNELRSLSPIFQSLMTVRGGVEDDHIPFLRRNVPVLHMIPMPFPRVWHTQYDTAENIHWPTVDKLTRIFAAFTVKSLNEMFKKYLPPGSFATLQVSA